MVLATFAGRLHLLILPLTVVAFLGLAAMPAFAAQTHVFQPPPIGSVGSGDDQVSLASNSGVAVNQATQDIYIADTNNHRVVQFDGNGAFVRAWGADVGGPGVNICTSGCVVGTAGTTPGAFQTPTFIAVDNSAGDSNGDVYVADTGDKIVSKFDASGNLIASWGSSGQLNGSIAGGGLFVVVVGIAVDSSGTLFVSGRNEAPGKEGRIFKFTQAGGFIEELGFSFGSAPVGIAVDSTGNIWVGRGNGHVAELSSSGEELSSEVGITATGFSLDPTNDDLYVAEADHIDRYDKSSKHIERFGFSPGAEYAGLAAGPPVGPPTEGRTFYVAEAAVDEIDEFLPGIVPDAITEAATAIAATGATLNGSVGAAGGSSATCVFQYADDMSFEAKGFKEAATAPCSPSGPFSGTAIQGVSAVISGLTAATTYHFRLLASNANGANENVNGLTFKTLPAVNLKTGAASSVTPISATLNGSINPEGTELQECLFEYGGSALYGQTVSCAETPTEIGNGNLPKPVHADISGLSPLTLYHFRLVAKNSLGTTKGADSIFGPPQVDAESFSQITTTGAAIEGFVNPDGVATTYVFQYVSDADFTKVGEEGEYAQAISVPLGGEAIGLGTKDVKVAPQIDGLTPSTTYHFRVVAENASGKTEGPDKTFTTFFEAPVGLPDGRVYEQVTPVDKNGVAPSGDKGLVQAAPSGGGITYSSGGGIPGTEGAQQYPTYLATRGADWSTQGLLPPASDGSSAAVLGWSEDLAQIYDVQGSVPGAPLSFLQRDSAAHSTHPIVTEVSAEIGSAFIYVGASADSSVVVFESAAQLPPGGATGTNVFNTYVWNRTSGELSLVGVFNNGLPPAKGSLAGSNEPNGHSHYLQAQHTVSSDGSRVFFQDVETGQLYVRLNPILPQSELDGSGNCTEPVFACTVPVSASQRAVPDPKGKKPATFWGATPDGSKAFFISPGKLTDNATTGPNDEGNDLYRYDVDSGVLTDLVPDATDTAGAGVLGVIGTSDDGSYVYFAANGVLASGASPGNCSGGDSSATGICNLYLWHDGAVVFISRLQNSTDGPNWSSGGLRENTSRVTPNGKTLLFSSGRQLSAYDNQGTPEFYRYRVGDPQLLCVSCNPTGAAPLPLSTPKLRSLQTLTTLPGPAAVLTRNLSSSGNQVFFETPDKLVASDTNGDASCHFLNEANKGGITYCQDVYEWEANGSGSCHSEAQNGGCLYLLSTGTSTNPSYFGDADPSGNNAFIFTDQRLVGQDKDQILDIYDARVGGGIASQNPPPPPVPCEGEGCKEGVPPAPAGETPGSASFSGPGNQKAAKQKKRHHKKKRHHRKHRQTKKPHASGKRG